MRRFEREVQGRLRFWEVDLEGTDLHVTTGEVGREGRTRTQKHFNAEMAASRLALVIEEMQQAGWTEVALAAEAVEDPAITAVLASPDDPAGYLVLGDQLLADHDPRGELVALQAALEQRGEDPAHNGPFGVLAFRPDPPDPLREAERALLSTHAVRFLGPLVALESPWDITWFCGWIRTLQLHATGFSTGTSDALAGLVKTGSLDFLRHLRIAGSPHLDAVAYVLTRRTWPVLDSIALGDPDDVGGTLTHPVTALLRHAPRLRSLVLSGHLEVVGALEHPTLASLALYTRQASSLDGLDLTGLPALRELVLSTALDTLSDRRALARAVDVPLDRLVAGGGIAIELLEGWSPRTARLDRLVLGPTPRAGHVVALLEQRADALRDLPIELVGIDLSDAELARLRALGLVVEADLPDVAVSRDRLYVSPRQETWRRFERTVDAKGRNRRYWEIVRRGSTLHVRFGKVDGAPTERESVLKSPERAAAEYRRRVRSKRAEGWDEVLDAV